MKLAEIEQKDFKYFDVNHVDIVICSSGYESRSAHLAKKLKKISKRQIVFGFNESQENDTRLKNDKIFTALGYTFFDFFGNSSIEVEETFLDIINEFESQKEISIIIDVSTMTRNWYGTIIKAISKLDFAETISISFLYTPSKFKSVNSDKSYPPNEVVSPIRGYSGLSIADKPTALVLGLGIDYERALGLKEELDPAETILFIPDPSIYKRYPNIILKANKEILDVTKNENTYNYSVFDIAGTFQMLESVCHGLAREYRVVLTSFGPKMFSVCCFLISTKYQEISVWRVTAGSNLMAQDKEPSNVSLILETKWSNDRIL